MWAKILLLFFVFSFTFRNDLSFDQDLGRHIKLGEIITNTWSIPKTNLFSYTNPDFSFINTHWLFEVMAYFFNRTIGLQFFLVLKIFIFLLSVWLVIKNIKSALLLPVGFIFLHVLRERVELRPEIFSFLFTALTYFILNKNNKLVFLLPLIQLIWINTHIYFFVGLILQAIYIFHLGYQSLRLHLKGGKLKLLSIIFILSVLVSFINPNGLAGFLYPLEVSKNYGYTIVENQTLFLLESINFTNPNFLWVKISIGIVALSLLAAFLKRKFEIKNILLALTGVILALMNVRSFPYLVFLSLPATLANFGSIKPKFLIPQFLIPLFALLLLFESYFYLNGDYYKYTNSPHQTGLKFVLSSKEAMDYVLANNLEGPIYNNFDIGSYIIYRGYPKYQVFVDGRPEAYPKEFFLDTYIPTQSDYAKFKQLEAKWQFKTIIFSHTDQTPWGKNFLQNIVKDESWKLVYIDDFMVVYTKEGPAIDLAKIQPNQFKFDNHVSYLRIGIFLLNNGFTEGGGQFIGKANSLLGNPTNNKFFW